MGSRGDSWETASGVSSSSSGLRATAAAAEEEEGEEEEDAAMANRVFVALPVQQKNGRSTIAWVLRHLAEVASAPAAAVVVVAHVHSPAQMIPMSMGGKFHASKLRPEQVSNYRKYEKEQVEKDLDEYLEQCTRMKVKCEKIVIENEDIASGIIELILLHGVTKLVMGAAADKQYSRKMKSPKSKTALAVMLKANTSCKIWFVCKEHLIYTRESVAPISRKTQSASAIRGSISNLSTWGATTTQSGNNAVNGSIQRSVSEKVVPAASRTSLQLHSRSTLQEAISRLNMEGTSVDSWDSIRRGSFPSSYRASFSTVTEEVLSDSSSSGIPRDDISTLAGSDFPNSAPHHEQGDADSDANLFDKLEEAFAEVEKYRKQAYDESLRRQRTEEDLISYHQKAKKSEDLFLNEAKQRKESEKTLAKANVEIRLLKEEMDVLKHNRDDIKSKLSEVSEQKVTLEQQAVEYGSTVNDLKDTVAASQALINSLQLELEQLKHERDNALKHVEELCAEGQSMVSSSSLSWSTEFSLLELHQATQNFNDAMKIGEGGFGCVYRGLLRNTTVAIKMLRSQNLQGQSQFQQEVAVLSRVRHPNLVTLVGYCSEASGLVYEFLPNGSLEDHLACENNTSPLTWQIRTRIIGEICSALIFLHSDKPHAVIHGDLKPANILLDANFVSKLSDFGISCLLNKSSTVSTSFYQTTNPRGTFAYMDPEFLTTGELTARSDIYSFGIIILRLVTGKPALGIAREVEDALDKGVLKSLVDRSAGDWPFVQAEKLMLLGLQCAELSRRRRPDRMNHVWSVVEPLVKSASVPVEPQSSGHWLDMNHTPFYFICPISQLSGQNKTTRDIAKHSQMKSDNATVVVRLIFPGESDGHNSDIVFLIVLHDGADIYTRAIILC
ncbi:U-box domain-containing protein 33-like isoform X2 [Oryza brachyantha]|uniref:U-box domain-containing protein 33-like isoform X2 n=1 Tax=Oryza brachyantha TaxID=4533 RepID=UPI0007762A86|nr:U-box domain-containing protein 33-like isoform X2 [Oryza brachyantha]